MVSPRGGDAAAGVDEIDLLVQAGDVDCLVVEAPGAAELGAAELTGMIDRAVDAGVPVFVLGADSSDSKRFAFFGAEERSAGVVAGTVVGRWASDSYVWIRKVGLLAGDPQNPVSLLRMEGFVEGLGGELLGIDFVNDPESALPVGFDPLDAYDLVRAWILAHPDVDVLLHADSGLETVAAAIADEGLYGDVSAVGFEMSEAVGDYIRDGVVVAALVRDSAAEGAAAAGACGDFLLAGVYEMGHVPVDPVAVTEANVNDGDWARSGASSR